jgi:hypothetical protein
MPMVRRRAKFAPLVRSLALWDQRPVLVASLVITNLLQAALPVWSVPLVSLQTATASKSVQLVRLARMPLPTIRLLAWIAQLVATKCIPSLLLVRIVVSVILARLVVR